MKNPITIISIFFNFKLLAQIYTKDAGLLDPVLTTNDYKFILIMVVSVGVALLMDSTDKTSSKLTFPKALLIVLLAVLFVFFSYEYAIAKNIAIIIAMIAAFLLGVFSLDIMLIIKRRVPELFHKAEGWIFKSKTQNDDL
ncbi:hypothetical protein [Leeuwenhoekiella sp. ZYFB001]|uniref:hypothetical protein n=1 Tax=Leeuwenhoekiella sp. ZYFB001 TaxID=2719912 RepID=UPI00142F6AF0|nr:hypothetical protein [Leeuwenhoekiella sp. ZYFB001]